jgi:hypothetical protein
MSFSRFLGAPVATVRPRNDHDSPTMMVALVASSVALGQAVQVYNGAYSPEAFQWAMLAFVLALLPIVIPQAMLSWTSVERTLPLVFAVALACEIGVLASNPPAIYLDSGTGHTLAEFQFLLGIAAVASGMAILAQGRYRRVLTPAVLVLFALMGRWIMKASPQPRIDVFSIHQESLAAFMRGTNPYTITFANPYHSTVWFSPGTATYDRLLFGYVYPAWTLLAALPGYVLAHDYRYSFVAAALLTGALAAYARPQAWSLAAAALFLFTPRGFFVLEQGWTEPSLLVAIALCIFAASRRLYWLLPIGVGIVACAKQYSILAAPAVFLLRPMFPNWRSFGVMLLKASAVAIVITLPLLLWGPKAYWHNVYGMQFTAPLRPDALSLPVFWANKFGSEMPLALRTGTPLLLTILTVLRAPRTPCGFGWAGGTIYFIFFMFRQAFCNYYYLVIGVYAVALAAAQLGGYPRLVAVSREPS